MARRSALKGVPHLCRTHAALVCVLRQSKLTWRMARSPMASPRKSLEATLAASTQLGKRGPSTNSYSDSTNHTTTLSKKDSLSALLVCAPSPLCSAAQRKPAQRSAGVSGRVHACRAAATCTHACDAINAGDRSSMHTSALGTPHRCVLAAGGADGAEHAQVIGRSGDRAIR